MTNYEFCFLLYRKVYQHLYIRTVFGDPLPFCPYFILWAILSKNPHFPIKMHIFTYLDILIERDLLWISLFTILIVVLHSVQHHVSKLYSFIRYIRGNMGKHLNWRQNRSWLIGLAWLLFQQDKISTILCYLVFYGKQTKTRSKSFIYEWPYPDFSLVNLLGFS